uniref:Protein kinase domain-containing protein n=1 Tax=Panagrolaimus davidi TaxID=227884 RepID=A0A914PSF8_9BILA
MAIGFPDFLFEVDFKDFEWPPYVMFENNLCIYLNLLKKLLFNLPIELILHVGLGMAYALAALHMAGFIHRNVSPHLFSYPVPLTLDLVSSRMIFTDFSLCTEYPYRNGPRVTVPFIGSLRYSSIRTHGT